MKSGKCAYVKRDKMKILICVQTLFMFSMVSIVLLSRLLGWIDEGFVCTLLLLVLEVSVMQQMQYD